MKKIKVNFRLPPKLKEKIKILQEFYDMSDATSIIKMSITSNIYTKKLQTYDNLGDVKSVLLTQDLYLKLNKIIDKYDYTVSDAIRLCIENLWLDYERYGIE